MKELSSQATVDIRKATRGDRVYIEVMQYARGHHVVAPYVLRAVPSATISTPLDWREVTKKLDPASFTMKKNVSRLAKRKIDPMFRLLGAMGGNRKKVASR
jgi:bifunctional non-homologous end joining protein LigD